MPRRDPPQPRSWSDGPLPAGVRQAEAVEGANVDPVRAKRTRIARLVSAGQRFGYGLFLVAIVMILGLVMIQTLPNNARQAPRSSVATTTQAPGDVAVAPTPDTLALLILNSESSMRAPAVLCVAVDGKDPSANVLAGLQRPSRTVVPASQCVRVANPASGSYHRPSGAKAFLLDVSGFRQGADAAQIRFNAFHSAKSATSKTLEVHQENGAWEIVRMLRHVEF